MSNLEVSPIKESGKEVVIIKQSKGQLEASIQKVEPYLDIEEFKDYCDSVHTCLAYQDTIIKKLKDLDNEA